MNCQKIEAHLPDLLFDPAAVHPEVQAHVETCTECREQLASLMATMNVLDEWTAPEPSPYFNTRMQASLRAAKEAPPEGFLERLRSRLLFSTSLHLRTAGAAALAAVLTLGGGSALWVAQQGSTPSHVQESATVRDLQSLDGNAQVFQQLNALDADTDSGSSTN